jgi:hypothetical protein
MERFENNFNSDPKNEDLLMGSHEQEVYVPAFHVQQEALAMYGIEVKEQEEGSYDTEGTLEDPAIKKKMYLSLIQELEAKNTHLLEFILGEKLLSKEELVAYGITSQKETALLLLKTMRGQQRSRDKETFIESGILTQEEAQEAMYSSI